MCVFVGWTAGRTTCWVNNCESSFFFWGGGDLEATQKEIRSFHFIYFLFTFHLSLSPLALFHDLRGGKWRGPPRSRPPLLLPVSGAVSSHLRRRRFRLAGAGHETHQCLPPRPRNLLFTWFRSAFMSWFPFFFFLQRPCVWMSPKTVPSSFHRTCLAKIGK